MKTPLRLVLVFVVLVGFASVSHAAPITFSISGTASGQLDSSSFSNALVTVSVTGNSDDVFSATDDFDLNGAVETIYALASSRTTVNIAGLGTFDVLDATAIYAFPPLENVEPGEELFLKPGVVIGTLDSPPSLDSFTGIAGIASDALLGYDLSTSIASIVGEGGVGRSPEIPVNTSGGLLFFDSNDVSGNTAAFAAEVPEPASLSLFAILSLAGWARFRKRA